MEQAEQFSRSLMEAYFILAQSHMMSHYIMWGLRPYPAAMKGNDNKWVWIDGEW